MNGRSGTNPSRFFAAIGFLMRSIPPMWIDAARRAEDAGDHAKRGRLPGAVGAEESEQLTLRHFEIDAVDRGEAAVPLRDVCELDHSRPRGPLDGRRPVHADDVDLQVAHESKQLGLTRYSTYDEPEVRCVSRELSECWIDRDPVVEQNFRPRVVIKFAIDVCQTRRQCGLVCQRPVPKPQRAGCARYNRRSAI